MHKIIQFSDLLRSLSSCFCNKQQLYHEHQTKELDTQCIVHNMDVYQQYHVVSLSQNKQMRHVLHLLNHPRKKRFLATVAMLFIIINHIHTKL